MGLRATPMASWHQCSSCEDGRARYGQKLCAECKRASTAWNAIAARKTWRDEYQERAGILSERRYMELLEIEAIGGPRAFPRSTMDPHHGYIGMRGGQSNDGRFVYAAIAKALVRIRVSDKERKTPSRGSDYIAKRCQCGMFSEAVAARRNHRCDQWGDQVRAISERASEWLKSLEERVTR